MSSPLLTTIVFLSCLLMSVDSLLANSPVLFSQKQPDFSKNDKKKTSKKNPLTSKPFAELKKTKDELLAKNDLHTAAKYLDAMIAISTDHEIIRELMLELADIYFQQSDWTKAEKVYLDFVLLYPGALKCDFAHYRAIICGTHLTLEPDRDQTKTQETLKLAQEFETLYPKSTHLVEVESVAIACRQKLYDSDVNVFNFYLKTNNFKAAQKRLDSISKEHIPHLPQLKSKTHELSIQLAQAQNLTLPDTPRIEIPKQAEQPKTIIAESKAVENPKAIKQT